MSKDEEESMMRKRAPKHTTNAITEAHGAPDDNEDKGHAKERRLIMSCGKFVLLTCLFSLLGLLLLAISGIDPTPFNIRSNLVNSSKNKSSLDAAPVSKRNWSRCTTNEHKYPNIKLPKQESSDKVEPLWLPAYPTSLPGKNGAIYAKFLTDLTGIDSASRNYYRVNKRLKRCHFLNDPNDIGVTCEIVHPIVPCERPHPSAQSANFGKVVLVALRNPLTAFPAYHQEKAEKYHNVKGQVEKSEWISFRDQWVGNATHNPLFEEWKNFIKEWRSMDPYTVAMYLPYERWSDEVRGPNIVSQLAEVLKREGLPVLYDATDNSNNPNDLECMWLKKVRDTIQEEEENQKDEGWYIPDYHPAQKQLLAIELGKFAKEISEGDSRPGDKELIGILHEYKDSILQI